MNPYKFLLISLTLMFFAGCTVRSNDQERGSDAADRLNPQSYQATPAKINEQDIEIITFLKDDMEKGELIMSMNVKNNSGKKILVNYTNCGLSVDAERVVVPQTTKTFKTELARGEEESYEISYYPINTVDFYLKTDYRGDMKQQYNLNLDFITDSKGKQLLHKNFTFTLSDHAYQSYIAKYAREKHMQIFDFDFDGEAFAAKQRGYLTKILPVKSHQTGHSVFAINPSVTINQLIINTLPYKYNDTLMVNIRMLNQDSRSLKILLSNSTIKAMDETYSLSNHFSDSFENGRLPDSIYIFKPGTRLHLLLKYYIPDKFDRFELNTDWVLVYNNEAKLQSKEWLKLFCRNISFKESSITKDSLNVN